MATVELGKGRATLWRSRKTSEGGSGSGAKGLTPQMKDSAMCPDAGSRGRSWGHIVCTFLSSPSCCFTLLWWQGDRTCFPQHAQPNNHLVTVQGYRQVCDLVYKTPAHASNERTHARAHTTVHNPRHACQLALKWHGSRALANDACTHAANARKWQMREMIKRANTARIPKKSAHVRLHPLTAYSPSVPGIAASRTGWKATRPAKSCCPTPWKMAVSPPCS